MKRYLILVLAFSMTTMLTMYSCHSNAKHGAEMQVPTAQQEDAGKVVTPEEFAIKLDDLRKSGSPFVLIDARTPGELEATGYLDGAVNLDWNSGQFQAEYEKLDRDVPVLVYCRSGGRSGRARELMVEHGFKEVYDMGGGMLQWLDEGRPVDKASGEEHAE